MARNTDGIQVGCRARALLAKLPQLVPAVRTFTLVRYVPTPGVEERLQPTSVAGVSKSSDQPASYLALLMQTWSEQKIVSELARHDDSDESSREFHVPANELTADFVDECAQELAVGQALALSSICTLENGERAHLPLLDFRPQPSDISLRMIATACRALRLSDGAILNSGRSYHVYGFFVMSMDAWKNLMIKSILLAPLVDVRYVAHRLLAGRSVLRITSTDTKPVEPEVVMRL